MAQIINAKKIRINREYSALVGLSSWSHSNVLSLDFEEDLEEIISGLKKGENLFDMLPSGPSSELRTLLTQPLSPDEQGLPPELYDIDLIDFSSRDCLEFKGRKFYTEEESQGPYFLARGKAGYAQRFNLDKKREKVILNPNKLMTEELVRLRIAIRDRR